MVFFSFLRAAVSYIPKKVVARPGENVTVHCVFNDHRMNASMAVWKLNFQPLPPPTLYHPVNQWVRSTKKTLSLQRFLWCSEHFCGPIFKRNTASSTVNIFVDPNQVSKITLHPSENQMYDLLRCTEEWSIPYSQIYVEGELCWTSKNKSKCYPMYFSSLFL